MSQFPAHGFDRHTDAQREATRRFADLADVRLQTEIEVKFSGVHLRLGRDREQVRARGSWNGRDGFTVRQDDPLDFSAHRPRRFDVIYDRLSVARVNAFEFFAVHERAQLKKAAASAYDEAV
jgi:hypothetical protein